MVSDSLRPMDYTVHGILQARIREWVAVPFSGGLVQPRDRTQLSHSAGRFFTSWATRETQEYWSGGLSLLQRIFPTRNWTGISYIAGGFFTNWDTRETPSRFKEIPGYGTHVSLSHLSGMPCYDHVEIWGLRWAFILILTFLRIL